MAKLRYDVLSPDGFSIHPTDTYESKEEAQQKLVEWGERFNAQGYYSANDGRIPVYMLQEHCQIVAV